MIIIPTKCGLKDKSGYFCRWGSKGKKYYYDPNDLASKERARKKADKQGKAIQVNKSKEIKEECKDCGVDEIDETGDKNMTEEINIIDDEIEDIPDNIDELKEGHAVKYKDKIGKIVKIIND